MTVIKQSQGLGDLTFSKSESILENYLSGMRYHQNQSSIDLHPHITDQESSINQGKASYLQQDTRIHVAMNENNKQQQSFIHLDDEQTSKKSSSNTNLDRVHYLKQEKFLQLGQRQRRIYLKFMARKIKNLKQQVRDIKFKMEESDHDSDQMSFEKKSTFKRKNKLNRKELKAKDLNDVATPLNIKSNNPNNLSGVQSSPALQVDPNLKICLNLKEINSTQQQLSPPRSHIDSYVTPIQNYFCKPQTNFDQKNPMTMQYDLRPQQMPYQGPNPLIICGANNPHNYYPITNNIPASNFIIVKIGHQPRF